MSGLTLITQVWRVKGHQDPSSVSGCQCRQEQGKQQSAKECFPCPLHTTALCTRHH